MRPALDKSNADIDVQIWHILGSKNPQTNLHHHHYTCLGKSDHFWGLNSTTKTSCRYCRMSEPEEAARKGETEFRDEEEPSRKRKGSTWVELNLSCYYWPGICPQKSSWILRWKKVWKLSLLVFVTSNFDLEVETSSESYSWMWSNFKITLHLQERQTWQDTWSGRPWSRSPTPFTQVWSWFTNSICKVLLNHDISFACALQIVTFDFSVHQALHHARTHVPLHLAIRIRIGIGEHDSHHRSRSVR